jgi:hypothetical protein
MHGRPNLGPQDVNTAGAEGLQAKKTQFGGFLVRSDHRILGVAVPMFGSRNIEPVQALTHPPRLFP